MQDKRRKGKRKGKKSVRLVTFHGYAHNWRCQLSFHPLYIVGFGLEDAEICECIFSSFNSLAVITWHASKYHWHQAIDIYAWQWDEDKYMELCMLCTFLITSLPNVIFDLY